MGPRPIFDFPDKIEIPKIPLKVENKVLMTIRNIGEIPAGFTLTCKWYVNAYYLLLIITEFLNPNKYMNVSTFLQPIHGAAKVSLLK